MTNIQESITRINAEFLNIGQEVLNRLIANPATEEQAVLEDVLAILHKTHKDIAQLVAIFNTL